MKQLNAEVIGTHLVIMIDTSLDCENLFQDIKVGLCNFETRFSRFIVGNWLHMLNASRRGSLDVDGKNMLTYMLELATKTDGYFDPTVGKRLTELGYGRIMNYESGITNREIYGDYRDIKIVGDEVMLHGDIFLEFGGVGKGYLMDIIKKHLQIFPRFLINFGGDIYGRGGWRVGLESPFFADEVIGIHILEDSFLACSAGTRRKWGNHHHLINPKTGESAREVVASYIEGYSGMITDGYATALCVMPWELAVGMLQKTPEISGVIVRHDGTLFQKEGSKSKVFS